MPLLNHCDGHGVALRTCTQTTHNHPRKLICANKGSYIGNPNNTIYIAPDFDGKADKSIPIHPCVSCGNHVCDECRIHCVYQNLYNVELHEGTGFGGHVFLRSWGNYVYPLHDEGSWNKNNNSKKFRPHHDQGVLSLRLDGRLGTGQLPLSVEGLLDTRLSDIRLDERVLRNTTELYDPLIYDAVHLAEGRKWYVCFECFGGSRAAERRCGCTLRSRFLDRWLCIPCYEHELEVDREYGRKFKKGNSSEIACLCGRVIDGLENMKAVCSWCDGEVVGC